MVQSDRSRPDKPRKGRPTPGPRTGGRPAPSPSSPRSPAAPRGAAPPARARGGGPAAPPSADTRLKAAPKRRPAVPAGAAAGTPSTPVTERPPLWRRAWDWLLEDPAKARRDGPTEHEKALAKVAARDREARRQLIRSAFRVRRGAKTVTDVAYVGPAAWPRPPLAARRARPPRSPASPPAPAAKERAPRARRGARGAGADGRALKVFPPLALLHALLGERRGKDADGKTVVVPPAETDWRWHLHRFFRSNVRGIVYLRALLLIVLVLTSAWVSLYATTGYDYTEAMFAPESEDPRDQYRLPFFIIESGSMMHPNAPWGRVGTVDPGDLVILEKYHEGMRIETFYGPGEREVAGAKGDVIMYLPVECRGCPPPQPIIHRAIAYLERDELLVPNPDTSPGAPRFLRDPRFTVEEFGIINANAVTIPELGLINYKPSSGGYITRGDNPRSNNWADQALGVTPFPVPEDRIIGRMKAEVPVVGLAKIALAGQEPGILSVDEAWCDFLAGSAACDTWVLFFIISGLTVGVPLVVTLVVFGRRWWQRRLDLIALRVRTDAEEKAAATAKDDDEATPGLRRFDATDLLSGKVQVVSAAPSGTASWEDLTRTGVRFEGD